jgi:hypothetical protein
LAGAYHPSLLLAILPLLVILHYLLSFAATRYLVLTSTVALSQSFSPACDPSPLPTILLCYSRSCANGCFP